MLLKNKIVKAEAVGDNKVILVLKSKCRHYSLVELTLDTTQDGKHGIFVTDVMSRCGLRKCAEKIS